MKSFKKVLAAVLTAAALMTSAASAATPSKSTAETPKVVTVKRTTNNTKATSLSVKSYANGQKATYKSNRKQVKVSKSGKVTIRKKFVGTARITVTRADGTTQLVVVVSNPTSTKIKAVKSAKKKLKVSWRKNSTVTGYQIQYAKSKNMKKSAKKVTVSRKSTTSKTLKAKKGTYYVRLRTYKKVRIAGTNQYHTYFSGWSTVKKVKVKG